MPWTREKIRACQTVACVSAKERDKFLFGERLRVQGCREVFGETELKNRNQNRTLVYENFNNSWF